MQTNQKPAALSGYQKVVIFILAMTQFTVVLDFMVMAPMGDILMKSLSLRPEQFGLAVSAYAFSAGASGLLTAGFADRFDRKKLLLFFYTGFIAGTVFCGLAVNYHLLIAARIITGLFGGVIGSITLAIVADIFSLEQRGRVMGFVQMGFGASQVLGIPIGLYLATAWGWQTTFIMIAGLGALIAVLILTRMRPLTEHLLLQRSGSAFSHLLQTVLSKRHRVGFTATALLSVGGFMMMPFSSAFAINNLHITEHQLPMLFMVSGVAALVVMPLIGKLSDQVDKFLLFSAASVWLMIVVLVYTNLSVTPLWLVMVFNVLMMVGIMSRMVPGTALTSAVPEMKDRGAFMSVNASLQQVAGGISAVFAGLIIRQEHPGSPLQHYDWVGYIVVAFSLLSIYLIYRVSRVVRQKSELAAAVPVMPEA
ncbi:MFS transporter [Pedobacter yulinensis]|uniref:MFS transporter n=1 Tax=Pedobacter yulinensis TaxID=2126353 RepID=A0A2T3HH19_9SPHI|nr:MFS transporter [Pedobacter yulinensis]PST81746.1 MFS transporter [Pedobacter yulinensis]